MPQAKMISAKKLTKMARKWQKLAAASRKRISFPRTNSESCDNNPRMADKGHFFVYTSDQKRFMIPLAYLRSEIFQELFRMAEEEFGISSDGPIKVPCDSTVMEYAISVIERHVARDLEQALLLSLVNFHYTSFSCLHEEHQQQLSICSF